MPFSLLCSSATRFQVLGGKASFFFTSAFFLGTGFPLFLLLLAFLGGGLALFDFFAPALAGRSVRGAPLSKFDILNCCPQTQTFLRSLNISLGMPAGRSTSVC